MIVHPMLPYCFQKAAAMTQSNQAARVTAHIRFIDLDNNMHISSAELRHVLICMGELITDAEVDEIPHATLKHNHRNYLLEAVSDPALFLHPAQIHAQSLHSRHASAGPLQN